MSTVSRMTGLVRPAVVTNTITLALRVSSAWAQQKQKVTYGVSAQGTRYAPRQTLDVGDEVRPSSHAAVARESEISNSDRY